MASSSTPTKKAPAKKPAKKAAGSSRVAALASKLATNPGSVTATASLPSTSGDAATAAASLLGLSPVAAPVQAAPASVGETVTVPAHQFEPILAPEQAEQDAATAIEDSSTVRADAVPADHPDETAPTAGDSGGTEEATAQPRFGEGEDTAAGPTRAPLALAPDPAPSSGEDADDTSPETDPTAPAEAAEPVALIHTPVPARKVADQSGATKTTASKATARKTAKKTVPADGEAEQVERLDELIWTLSSPEHSLDQQHDRISKLTLELPIPLVDVLNRWELDQVRRTGRRLYRERLIDLALAQLPSDMDKVVAMARDLPAWLKYAETEQVGSRVRAPVALELKVMKQELKLRREKGTYVRHIYAVALLDFLTSYDVPVEEPAP